MRYRPFGSTEMAVSAVSLALIDGAIRRDLAGWRTLTYEALENGINAFEIVGQDPLIADGLAEGLQSIDRHLAFVALRIGRTATGGADFTPEGLSRTIQALLARTGIEYLDALLLNDPAEESLSNEALETLVALRNRGIVRQIGVAGESPAIDFYISSGKFDVLATGYSLFSGWGTRNRIRDAVDRNMAIIGYGFCPPQIGTEPERPGLLPRKLFWGAKPEPAAPESSAYAFLHDTGNWTAEEICLAFALTQPALATVQVTSDQAPRLAELAASAERELPPGLAPRIEMARFGGPLQQRA